MIPAIIAAWAIFGIWSTLRLMSLEQDLYIRHVIWGSILGGASGPLIWLIVAFTWLGEHDFGVIIKKRSN